MMVTLVWVWPWDMALLMQALELSYIRLDGHPDDFGTGREAALLLRQTLFSLMRLTSLDLDHVDFTD